MRSPLNTDHQHPCGGCPTTILPRRIAGGRRIWPRCREENFSKLRASAPSRSAKRSLCAPVAKLKNLHFQHFRCARGDRSTRSCPRGGQSRFGLRALPGEDFFPHRVGSRNRPRPRRDFFDRGFQTMFYSGSARDRVDLRGENLVCLARDRNCSGSGLAGWEHYCVDGSRYKSWHRQLERPASGILTLSARLGP